MVRCFHVLLFPFFLVVVYMTAVVTSVTPNINQISDELKMALNMGNFVMVRELLESLPSDMDLGDKICACALIPLLPQPDLLRLALRHTHPDHPRCKLFSMAFSCRHLESFRVLLEDGRSDPNNPNCQFLLDACQHGKLDFLEALLADPRIDPSRPAGLPLIFACRHGQLSVVRRLLRDDRVMPVIEIIPSLRYESFLSLPPNRRFADLFLELLSSPKVTLYHVMHLKSHFPPGINFAFVSFLKQGDHDLVSFIIRSRLASKKMIRWALYTAIRSSDRTIVSVLLKHLDYFPALQNYLQFKLWNLLAPHDIMMLILHDLLRLNDFT